MVLITLLHSKKIIRLKEKFIMTTTNNAEKRKELENLSKKTVEPIYHNKIVNLEEETLHLQNGSNYTRALIRHPGAVAIIPVTNTGNIILIKQYRFSIDKVIIEIPAGTLEHNEDPTVTAQRELQEEVGFKANKITQLGSYYPSPGILHETIHLFVAQELEQSSLPQDDDEAIDIFEVTQEKAISLVNDNTITDAKTVIGIFKYLQWKNNGNI
jgi:ADP-ribose pyrophosphatase